MSLPTQPSKLREDAYKKILEGLGEIPIESTVVSPKIQAKVDEMLEKYKQFEKDHGGPVMHLDGGPTGSVTIYRDGTRVYGNGRVVPPHII